MYRFAKKAIAFTLATLMLAGLCAGCAGSDGEKLAKNALFVSPTGSDEATGSRKAPLKTVQKAMELVKPGQTVYLSGGTYEESVRMTGGTEKEPVTLTALPGETARIFPGVSYGGSWSVYKEHIYTADLSEIAEKIDRDDFQLFLGTEALVDARYPNMSAYQKDVITAERGIAQEGTDGTRLVTADALGEEIVGAQIVIWPGASGQAWDGRSARVAAVEGNTLIFTEPLNESPEYTPNAGNPYYIVGALCLLDAPGEYYFDKETNKVYVYLPDGSDPTGKDIRFRGSNIALDCENCSYINIEGIEIYGGGVYLVNAEDCTVKNCKILYQDFTNYISTASVPSATYISGKRNRIEGCEIGYTSLSGVTVVGEDHVITDNWFHDCDQEGCYYAPVVLGFREDPVNRVEISYNAFYNSGRMHIYIKPEVSQQDNVIRGNYMENHSCLTSDCGAFYAWGTDGGGTVIYENVVINSTLNENGIYTKQVDGIYLDNYSKNYTVHHNIVVGGMSGIRTNLPAENVAVYNNTLIGNDMAYGLYGGESDEADCATMTFVNNLVVDAGKAINYYAVEDGQYNYYSGGFESGAVPLPINGKGRMISATNRTDYEVNADYTLSEDSFAIDAGTEVPGITDGFTGAAPDVGALEYGKEPFAYGTTWELPLSEDAE